MMSRRILTLATIFVVFITSCQKSITDALPETTVVDTVPGATQTDLLKDSVYLYSKEIYLWPEVIPAYNIFNPRGYTGATDLAAASAVMNGIRKLEPRDKFSFVTTKESSDGLQTGEDVDFGFMVKAGSPDVAEPVDTIRWYVSYVYSPSSAGLAGVQRGWYVNKINNTTLGYTQASVDLLNSTYNSATSAQFEFIKPDGTAVSLNLNKTSFTANSVLYNSVINTGGKKVGYLVFNQFFGAPSRTELSTVFANFKTQGITELVVDLRYNPGGSTATQDALANFIAPAAANNQVMYKYIFNSNLQQGNFPLLKQKPGFSNVSFSEANNTVKYSNTGSLNLSHVFFIVTGSSASASELIINNLKPYMDVKIIGDTTYGKPVGFFPVDIYQYSIYPISFKTVNSAGSAEYYSGFAPDKVSPDGVNKNWGDVTEPCLAYALRYINTGAFRVAGTNNELLNRQYETQKKLQPLMRQLEAGNFSGMFYERK